MEEALAAPPPPPPPFAAARRRSHLDSASYRTLIRIFSHCLDFSLHPLAAASGEVAGDCSGPSESSPACKGAGFCRSESKGAENVVGNATGEEPVSSPEFKGASFDRGEGKEEEAVVGNSNLERSGDKTNVGKAADEHLVSPACSPAWTGTAFERNGSREREAVVGNSNLEQSGDDNDVGNAVDELPEVPESSSVHKGAAFDRNESKEREAVVGTTSSFEQSCDRDKDLCEEFRGGEELDEKDEILKSVEECLQQEDVKLVEKGLGNDALLNDMITGLSELIDSDLSELIDAAKDGGRRSEGREIVPGELQKDEQKHGTAEFSSVDLRERVQEEPSCGLDPIASPSGCGNLGQDQIDDGEFEEGEILDDAQDLDEEDLDSGFRDGILEDQESGEEDHCNFAHGHNENFHERIWSANETKDDELAMAKSNLILRSQSLLYNEGHLMQQNKRLIHTGSTQPDVISFPAENYEEALNRNEITSPSDEAHKADKKRKRVLTEERKAKKKKAQRIKRAQKERAEGVRRLKLLPVVKPKVVKYCHFYLLGKCQQGDLCKFSHDTTPLTKSKPCKHFAYGSCLKGDDCPFDHELSKYPCHNFMAKGMCIRGIKCKFSHVMSTVEGPSTVDAKKSGTLLPSENADLRKQTDGQKTSIVPNGESVTTTPARPYSNPKHLENTSVNVQKAPPRIPKGMRFLSFGKGDSYSTSPRQENLPMEKHSSNKGGYQQNLRVVAAEGHKITEHNGEKSLPRQDETSMLSKAALRPSFDPKKSSLATESAADSGSRSIQNQVSEASKILQEFLFGAGS